MPVLGLASPWPAKVESLVVDRFTPKYVPIFLFTPKYVLILCLPLTEESIGRHNKRASTIQSFFLEELVARMAEQEGYITSVIFIKVNSHGNPNLISGPNLISFEERL